MYRSDFVYCLWSACPSIVSFRLFISFMIGVLIYYVFQATVPVYCIFQVIYILHEWHINLLSLWSYFYSLLLVYQPYVSFSLSALFINGVSIYCVFQNIYIVYGWCIYILYLSNYLYCLWLAIQCAVPFRLLLVFMIGVSICCIFQIINIVYDFVSVYCFFLVYDRLISLRYFLSNLSHYENTPIQIYRKFHLQKTEKFRQKLWYFSDFCSKHRLWVLVRTASARRF